MASNAQQVRLMAKVARLYHERGMKQTEIAAELHVSQPRISRLLKAAADSGLVRTIVSIPPGVHTDVEEQLAAKYGLSDAVVVEADEREDLLLGALGSAGAAYLETTLTGHDRIGISSWSAALLSVVEALPTLNPQAADVVVQLVGGNGESAVQVKANRLLTRLATLAGATPVFLNAPAMLPTAADVRTLLGTPTLQEAQLAWEGLTLALVGIGAVQPSALALQSGNAFPLAAQAELHALGAVGDICFRFFDADGQLVDSALNDTIVGISADLLRRVPRRVGVAAGSAKVAAIRAALTGGWINVLITELATANALL
jgi:DNA-binding transcriptional regulator LsrR (DeoR family)